VSRRRTLALGAAAVAAMALAACGNSSNDQSQNAANTARAAASALPAGALSTAQALASAVPPGGAATAQAAATGAAPTVAAAASRAPSVASAATTAGGAANASDPSSRNNKYKAPPAMTIDKAKKYTATIVTNKGTMKAELYADTAPITVNNFVFLAKDGFYDGVTFHRIVAGFVVQGGDPTGTGTGGPGYKFADEPIPANRNYEKGTLAMANSGPNTNGSQFFICLDNLTAKGALPKQYNLFGKVTDGLDTLDKILAVPRTMGSDGAQSKPTEKVFMQTVTIEST
jgi:cyclophilin family peptidyl-prolyl cis-trans isomerase